MAYDLISDIKPDIPAWQAITEDLRKYHVKTIVLSPTRWATFPSEPHLTWETVKFNREDIKKIPDDRKGVYSFIVQPGIANHPMCSYLLYIGKTERQSLQQRINQYFYEVNNPKGRAPVQDMLIKWSAHLWVCYTPVDEIDKIDKLENSLLEAFVPPMNQQYRGVFLNAVKAWQT